MKKNRKQNNKQRELLEVKNISEMKTNINGINSRLNTTEEKISDIDIHGN